MVSHLSNSSFANSYPFIFYILFCFPFVLLGAFLIYNYQDNNSDLCPKCSYGHMLLLNTVKANKFIQTNNIKI